MKVHIVGFEPSKKAKNNGAITLVIALESPNKKAAEGIAIGKLWEAYPAAADNFNKPFIVEDQPGCPRPAIGVFDEQFAIDNEFDGKCWQPKVAEKPAELIDLMHLGDKERVVAVALFGLNPVDSHNLSVVRDYIDNPGETEDETGLAAIIDAMCSVSQVFKMHPDGINNLLLGTISHFENQEPSEEEIRQFVESWVSNPRERGSVATSTSTSTEDNGGVPDYNTLSMHTALSIMATHPTNAKASDVKNAKEIIASRDSAWRAWDKTLRVIVGILNVDTDTRHAIISEGLKNPKLVNNDNERLHFVKTFLTGHPACPELADYGQQVNQTQPAVKNLGGGNFSVDGLISEQPNTASNEVEKQEVTTTAPITDEVAQQSKETLDQLGYSVYGTNTGGKSEHLQRAEKTLADANELVEQLKSDDFQQRASLIEQFFAEQQQASLDNLEIWNRVYKTDPTHTKAFANNGGGTSINGTYMVMQATKVFGPQGINWRVEVIEERFDDGAPIMRSVTQQDGTYLKEVIPNGNGGYLCEVNHTVRINLHFEHAGKKGVIPAYGCTPYIQSTKNGVVSDGEAPKKSLTDATKKALSQLGFSADVFLGLYDDVKYREENKAEFAIKNASDKAEGVTRLREELDEKLTKVADTISKAVTVNEANKVHASIAREVEAYRKASEAKGDMEHAKYLAGRLRRLTTLKDERIATLSKSEENAQ